MCKNVATEATNFPYKKKKKKKLINRRQINRALMSPAAIKNLNYSVVTRVHEIQHSRVQP